MEQVVNYFHTCHTLLAFLSNYTFPCRFLLITFGIITSNSRCVLEISEQLWIFTEERFFYCRRLMRQLFFFLDYKISLEISIQFRCLHQNKKAKVSKMVQLKLHPKYSTSNIYRLPKLSVGNVIGGDRLLKKGRPHLIR